MKYVGRCLYDVSHGIYWVFAKYLSIKTPIRGFFTSTDPAIDFGLKVHPICLPVSSNIDPNKWRNQNVKVLGFSTLDRGASITRGDRLKASTMIVFNQTTCNSKLETELNTVQKCKLYFFCKRCSCYFRYKILNNVFEAFYLIS